MVDFNKTLYLYDDYINDIKKLQKKNKKNLKCITIGHSHDNRDIFLLKLGKGKKKIFISSGVHGRESINIIAIMKIIEDLLINKEDNILSKFTFYIIPLLNPDGYMIALNGFNEIRNTRLRDICKKKDIPYLEWKYNARGVDINRNFPSVLWLAKDIYDYVASENETKILMKVFKKYKTIGYFDIHSRGNEIYYYRNAMDDEYNELQLYIAANLSYKMGYRLVEPEQEINQNDTGGNTVHYYSEYYDKPAITIETIDEDERFPLDIKLRHVVYEDLQKFFNTLERIFYI